MKRTTLPFAAIAVIISAAAARPSAADDGAPNRSRRTITVSGEGDASGAPDVAVTTLGVESLDPKVGPAVADANARMRTVLDAVKRAGVAARDVRTVEFSIGFEQNPPPPRAAGEAEARPTGNYRVRNVAQITIRDLARASAVLDAAVGGGANTVSGIAFTIEDPAPLRAKAREAAIADARARAEALARASGVAVGPVLSISENGGGPIPRPMLARSIAPMEAGAPVESGQLSEHAQVEVVYEIAPRAP
ncbi:MAG TPA: SIMPL domain-containing protein [Thermoanaerobaculia bacterium]|nr:SIMPL domain-containing protein [Thermoanaerobaculia bacterium]